MKTGPVFRRTSVKKPALSGVSFEIQPGEIFGLLGPNGAGKTTTIDIISGLLDSESGDVRYWGQPLTNETKRRMNSTTAYASLYYALSIEQNMRIFADLYEVDNPEGRITYLLDLFKMADLRKTALRDLSAGQQTRVKLMKGLINAPELLLLDEATIGLDPDVAEAIRGIIKGLGISILFTSHNMDEVALLCDRIAFLSQGKVLATGTPRELSVLIPHQHLVVEYKKMTPALKRFIASRSSTIIENAKCRLRIRIAHDASSMGAHIERLVRTGCGITDIIIEKPDLEDVFLSIARRS